MRVQNFLSFRSNIRDNTVETSQNRQKGNFVRLIEHLNMNIFSTYNGMLLLFIMMITCCNIGFNHGCMDEERTALQEITESMGYGHDSYENSHSSRFFDDCCRWEGVHCSPTNSQVIGIYFYFIKKDSEEQWFLDMSLFSKLEHLQELHLVGNNIGGLDNPEGKFLTYALISGYF